MPHNINGIITSYKYDGELPYVVLVGNYCFIPLEHRHGPSYADTVELPYRWFTKNMRALIKELSFKGKCVYIETDYHGGYGNQVAETWEQGEKVLGPLISYNEDPSPEAMEKATMVKQAINQNLAAIGIYRHGNLDEFDTVRLGHYRSNQKALEEYKRNPPPEK